MGRAFPIPSYRSHERSNAAHLLSTFIRRPMTGAMITAPLLSLFVLPAIYKLLALSASSTKQSARRT